MGIFSSKKSKTAQFGADALTVWGRANSVNVQKPLWLLHELGTPFLREDVGGPFGRLDSAEFTALSPHGVIPVLVDRRFGDDIVVWEAAAIVRHLAEAGRRLGDPSAAELWPEEMAAQAQIDRWAEWAQANFYEPMRDLFINIVRVPASERNLDMLRRAASQANAVAASANSQLEATGAYLAGPKLTIADIPFAAMLHRYMTLEISRPDLPALSAYYERLKARRAYADVVAVVYDNMRIAGAERSETPLV